MRLHWGAVAVAAVLGLLVADGVLPQLVPGQADAAYLIAGVIAGAALLVSIFIHEASHAVVARRHGVDVSSITLWFLGGVAHLEDEAPNPRAEAQIAGAGPASSLAIAVVVAAWGLAVSSVGLSLLAVTLYWVSGLNVILAVFNLLPGAPLDGGRLLHAWLWKRHGDRSRATVGAARAGRGVGLLVAAFGLFEVLTGNLGGLWTAMIGWFLYGAAGQEARSGRLSAVLSGRKIADVMAPIPPMIANWTSLRDLLGSQSDHERIVGVDFGGTVTLVSSRAEIARAAARAVAGKQTPERLRDLPLPEPVEVDIAEPASAILRHPGRPIVVTQDSQPVGIVTSSDVERIVAVHHLATDEVAA
ncbi:MAG: site-2 protease family protein [Acidimicrobiia bacterium]|nr:site-2 protease family protein [Acidimicrobiia bacterium]